MDESDPKPDLSSDRDDDENGGNPTSERHDFVQLQITPPTNTTISPIAPRMLPRSPRSNDHVAKDIPHKAPLSARVTHRLPEIKRSDNVIQIEKITTRVTDHDLASDNM